MPIGLTKCERSFSKLKIAKNRLRSSMGQPRLCALMLISVEREQLQHAVIDEFAASPLLRNFIYCKKQNVKSRDILGLYMCF